MAQTPTHETRTRARTHYRTSYLRNLQNASISVTALLLAFVYGQLGDGRFKGSKVKT